MTGAILNFFGVMKDGKYHVHCEICGTFFFISPDRALTANHVVYKDFLNADEKIINKQSFLIGENNFIAEIQKEFLIDHKDIDVSIIKFPKAQSETFFEIAKEEPIINQEFYFKGYTSENQPLIETHCDKLKIILKKADLSPLNLVSQDGFVKKLKSMTVKTTDLDMDNVNVIELSCGGFVGMSGAPVIDKVSGKVIGLISFGDTTNSDKKETLFAVDCTELNKII